MNGGYCDLQGGWPEAVCAARAADEIDLLALPNQERNFRTPIE
jgi:hypothetical protein